MEELKNCPACGQTDFTTHLFCEDHFLTKEKFSLVRCKNCDLIFTNPRPIASDLGKYYKSEEYISHSNSQKGIVNKVYHWIRRRNHKTKFQLITKYVDTGRLLDIGCATGEFANYFKSKGWEVTGVEPDADARKFALTTYNIKVLPEEDIQKLEAGSYDVITLWHVLEHVPELGKRIRELKSLLHDNGLLVIAVPNPESYDAKYYGEFWAGYDVPRHLYHFSQKAAKGLFERFGLSCIGIIPMKFDSYYVSMLSEKYRNSGSRLMKAYRSGCRSNKYAKKNDNNYSSLIYLLKK
jgi:2-polyprenyl-3-methyl-5-hydroxy-6-metoxy-1,4-benzoquinol methylase